jgi:hypothetical protein
MLCSVVVYQYFKEICCFYLQGWKVKPSNHTSKQSESVWSFGLLLSTEDRSSIFLQNDGKLLWDYIVPHPRS